MTWDTRHLVTDSCNIKVWKFQRQQFFPAPSPYPCLSCLGNWHLNLSYGSSRVLGPIWRNTVSKRGAHLFCCFTERMWHYVDDKCKNLFPLRPSHYATYLTFAYYVPLRPSFELCPIMPPTWTLSCFNPHLNYVPLRPQLTLPQEVCLIAPPL